MAVILRFVGGILTVYMVLLFIRILLTWFSGQSTGGRAVEMLHRVTDPYLGWFRRFSFLQTGRIDFSPIAAIIVLVIVLNIVNTLAMYGRITIGIVLALVVSAVGSAFFFIVGFFLLLTLVRAVSVFIGSSSVHPFWLTLDAIINPVLASMQRTFFRNRQLSYRSGLATGTLILAVLFFAGRFVLHWFVGLLSSLPV